MSSSMSDLPVSTPFSITLCHFLSGVAVHVISFLPVMAAAMTFPRGSRSIAVKLGWDITIQLPLSFHLTAMILVLAPCCARAALTASTAFIPVKRSWSTTVGGICSTSRAGWWRCQGLLGCEGGCVGFGDLAIGLGRKVGPVAKTSLGLVGLWEGVGMGAVRLSSSTSLASFLMADNISPEGPCSPGGFSFVVLRCISCTTIIVRSGITAWMDNLFRVSATLSRVLCSETRSSVCEGSSPLFAV